MQNAENEGFMERARARSRCATCRTSPSRRRNSDARSATWPFVPTPAGGVLEVEIRPNVGVRQGDGQAGRKLDLAPRVARERLATFKRRLTVAAIAAWLGRRDRSDWPPPERRRAQRPRMSLRLARVPRSSAPSNFAPRRPCWLACSVRLAVEC